VVLLTGTTSWGLCPRRFLRPQGAFARSFLAPTRHPPGLFALDLRSHPYFDPLRGLIGPNVAGNLRFPLSSLRSPRRPLRKNLRFSPRSARLPFPFGLIRKGSGRSGLFDLSGCFNRPVGDSLPGLGTSWVVLVCALVGFLLRVSLRGAGLGDGLLAACLRWGEVSVARLDILVSYLVLKDGC
jgi:hypothetical protein